MKTSIIKSTTILLLAVFASFSITSCSKDDNTDEKGHLHVYFNNRYGLTEALSYSTVYTATNGRDFTVETNQYYISNARLVTHDGTEVPTDAYVLVQTDSLNELEFEDIAAGHYTALRFDVGIDSTTNHADPSTVNAGSPLASQMPPMYWSWNSGYIFMRLEGLVDTSAAISGTKDYTWELHLGLDANKVSVELPINATVSGDAHPGVNVFLNTAKLFTGIDLGGADKATHSMDNMPLAAKLKANIATAFTAE